MQQIIKAQSSFLQHHIEFPSSPTKGQLNWSFFQVYSSTRTIAYTLAPQQPTSLSPHNPGVSTNKQTNKKDKVENYAPSVSIFCAQKSTQSMGIFFSTALCWVLTNICTNYLGVFSRNMPFPCNRCAQSFDTEQGLKLHKRKSHQAIVHCKLLGCLARVEVERLPGGGFQCPNSNCKRVFENPVSLQQHTPACNPAQEQQEKRQMPIPPAGDARLIPLADQIIGKPKTPQNIPFWVLRLTQVFFVPSSPNLFSGGLQHLCKMPHLPALPHRHSPKKSYWTHEKGSWNHTQPGNLSPWPHLGRRH